MSGRVVIVGAISQYNLENPDKGNNIFSWCVHAPCLSVLKPGSNNRLWSFHLFASIASYKYLKCYSSPVVTAMHTNNFLLSRSSTEQVVQFPAI